MNIMWNVHYFATTYMALDDFQPERFSVEDVVHLGRKEALWILSRLHSLIREYSSNLERHHHHKAAAGVLASLPNLGRTLRWMACLRPPYRPGD